MSTKENTYSGTLIVLASEHCREQLEVFPGTAAIRLVGIQTLTLCASACCQNFSDILNMTFFSCFWIAAMQVFGPVWIEKPKTCRFWNHFSRFWIRTHQTCWCGQQIEWCPWNTNSEVGQVGQLSEWEKQRHDSMVILWCKKYHARNFLNRKR